MKVSWANIVTHDRSTVYFVYSLLFDGADHVGDHEPIVNVYVSAEVIEHSKVKDIAVGNPVPDFCHRLGVPVVMLGLKVIERKRGILVDICRCVEVVTENRSALFEPAGSLEPSRG
jgi:hypothetical protein